MLTSNMDRFTRCYFGGGSPPPIPPPPVPPAKSEAATNVGNAAGYRSKGRSSTILAGMLNNGGQTQGTVKKTLLGS